MKGTIWSYYVYGIGIRSELEFPELRPCRAPADVQVRFGRVSSPVDVRERELSIFAAPDGTFFCGGARIGVLAVRSGTEIAIDRPYGHVDNRLLRYVVLGTALRALLHQRGLLVLHASVVALAGGGVAFIGVNGAGKSTIAAALLANGQRVVSDDIAAIDVTASTLVVYPSVPQLKLWPAAAVRLCSAPADLTPIVEGNSKLAWQNPKGWINEPVPLARVFELATGSATVTRPLGSHTAIEALLRNSYTARLGLLTDGKAAAVHLGQCIRIARKLPVRTFSVRRDLDGIGEAARIVMQDCGLG